ncbi:MAG: hypothetical protein IJ637_02160 [Prevotella sp.]|nr:hypothetical protein [Prevotella sp.]
MKRIIILLAITVCQLSAMAQKDLHIGALFDGKIVAQDKMVETRVRGRSLSKYGLTYFRSLRFSPNSKEEKTIKQLLKEDMEEQTVENYRSREDDDNALYQVFIELPPQGDKKRMLCYKQHFEKVLVIYLEGPQATFKTLEKMTNK